MIAVAKEEPGRDETPAGWMARTDPPPATWPPATTFAWAGVGAIGDWASAYSSVQCVAIKIMERAIEVSVIEIKRAEVVPTNGFSSLGVAAGHRRILSLTVRRLVAPLFNLVD